MIQIDDLSFSYTKSLPYVLSGLDFRAKSGSYVSILGENGCGKSTLIKLILGLLSPSRGKIRVAAARRAFVPQINDFADSRFPITVREMLDSYRRLLKIKDRQRLSEALEAVGMGAYPDRLMSALSGGQRQKVFIARAIMGQPELLVLDEPSAGVDASSRLEIYAYLKQLNQSKGVTILSVEHNLEAAIRNSTAIYHMAAGHGHICDPQSYAKEYLKLGEGALL